jgi:hypothetical protein
VQTIQEVRTAFRKCRPSAWKDMGTRAVKTAERFAATNPEVAAEALGRARFMLERAKVAHLGLPGDPIH